MNRKISSNLPENIDLDHREGNADDLRTDLDPTEDDARRRATRKNVWSHVLSMDGDDAILGSEPLKIGVAGARCCP
jgi:hypothetical protein